MGDDRGPERYPAYRSPTGVPGYFPHTGLEHPQGTVVLVLGIVGIFTPVVSFIAWHLGRQPQREADAPPGLYSDVEQIRVGRILGLVFSWLQIAAVIVTVLVLLIPLLFVLFAVAAAGS